MDGNVFTIDSSWDWRPESPREIGEKFLKTLDALSAISPHFHPWRVLAHPNEISAETIPLEDVRARFTERVECGVFCDDDDIPIPAGGYSVFAFNNMAESGPFSVCLSAEGGGDAHLRRIGGVEFHTSRSQIPDPSIVTYPIFKAALTTLVSIWGIGNAKVYSSDLGEYWDFPPLRFDLNWMVYLSAPLARQITPPKGVIVERTDDGGLYLIAAEETFDTSNLKHLRAAADIRDALAPLNDLLGHEREKRDKEEADRDLKAMGGLRPLTHKRKPLPF